MIDPDNSEQVQSVIEQAVGQPMPFCWPELHSYLGFEILSIGVYPEQVGPYGDRQTLPMHFMAWVIIRDRARKGQLLQAFETRAFAIELCKRIIRSDIVWALERILPADLSD